MIITHTNSWIPLRYSAASELRKNQENFTVLPLKILFSGSLTQILNVTRSDSFKATYDFANISSAEETKKMTFRELALRQSDSQSVSFFTLYGGQVTFSAQLLTLNYLLFSKIVRLVVFLFRINKDLFAISANYAIYELARGTGKIRLDQ